MSSETTNKPKLQLRSTLSFNGDKTPSPATKLLINHGKPNFTIQRNGTKQNGDSSDIKPLSPQGENNNNNNTNTECNFDNNNNNNNIDTVDSKTHNYNPYKSSNSFYNNKNYKNINDGTIKSTNFNGTLRPATLPMTNKNNLNTSNSNENEASKVVLRRTKITETSSGSSSITEGDDDATVPEFIRRQRLIQERLAKENVLDFENRRSGYFTQVMMSPTATAANRTSFAETMSSPAVNPALEMPPLTQQQQHQQQQTIMATHTEHIEHVYKEEQHESHDIEINEITKTTKTSNGHHFVEEEEEEEEEEVAKAIEEVNKAVANHEDYNGHVHDEHHQQHEFIQPRTLESVIDTTEQPPLYKIHAHHPAEHLIAEIIDTNDDNNKHVTHTIHETKEDVVHATVAVATLEHVEEITTTTTTTTKHIENGHSSVVETTTTTQKVEQQQQQQNGHNDITISHTNGFEGPCIPAPDPSGVLGVNFEPKTVVSFSKDLATEINKYPDTVRDVDGEPVAVSAEDQRLKELTKLKFDIKADEEDVKVTPVLRTDVELK